jgi:hypothetical protein
MQPQNDAPDEFVPVLLKLDPKVHEAFLRKAQKAEVELEEFLGKTLTVVLGCRMFDKTYENSTQATPVQLLCREPVEPS